MEASVFGHFPFFQIVVFFKNNFLNSCVFISLILIYNILPCKCTFNDCWNCIACHCWQNNLSPLMRGKMVAFFQEKIHWNDRDPLMRDAAVKWGSNFSNYKLLRIGSKMYEKDSLKDSNETGKAVPLLRRTFLSSWFYNLRIFVLFFQLLKEIAESNLQKDNRIGSLSELSF